MKLSNVDYWQKRHEEWIFDQNAMDEKAADRMIARYDKLAKKLERQLGEYYEKYGEDNVIEFTQLRARLDEQDRELLIKDLNRFIGKYPGYAHLAPAARSIYQADRLQGLILTAQLDLLELGALEGTEMARHLRETYIRNFDVIAKELGHGAEFSRVNRDVLNEQINEAWTAGGNFSDRIWRNKAKLTETLKKEIANGIATGENYGKMVKTLRDATGAGAHDARRLVWTESSRMLNEAHGAALKASDVTEYIINAMMDHRTSTICKGQNGRRYKFSEAVVGYNYPPFHPFCRTTIIGVLG